MHRIAGVILPDNKRIDYALTLIYGIGWSKSVKVLDQAKVPAEVRVKDISEAQIKKIVSVIDTFRVEGDLREEINDNIKRAREIGSYRGLRHRQGLPSRGQRTRSNARTKRGKRKTVGAFTKEAWAKAETSKNSA